MDKQDLIRMAEELHRGAFDANAYFLILQQYQKNLHDYEEEMKTLDIGARPREAK